MVFAVCVVVHGDVGGFTALCAGEKEAFVRWVCRMAFSCCASIYYQILASHRYERGACQRQKQQGQTLSIPCWQVSALTLTSLMKSIENGSSSAVNARVSYLLCCMPRKWGADGVLGGFAAAANAAEKRCITRSFAMPKYWWREAALSRRISTCEENASATDIT